MYRDINLLVTSGVGTVGHDEHPPANVDCGEIAAPVQSVIQSRYPHASVKYGSCHTLQLANTSATLCYLLLAKKILRAQRLRDLLASIEEYRRASGRDRVWWRHDALWRLAEWRRRYRQPERAAFQATVAASRGARP